MAAAVKKSTRENKKRENKKQKGSKKFALRIQFFIIQKSGFSCEICIYLC